MAAMDFLGQRVNGVWMEEVALKARQVHQANMFLGVLLDLGARLDLMGFLEMQVNKFGFILVEHQSW